MREIDMLVVHCTASPDHADQIGVADVRLWHVQKGWSDIGYHWLVNKQGGIEQGRAEDIPGAHARGYNKHSLGIVWVGTDNCNTDQWMALIEKCAQIVEKYDIPIANIVGHCELPDVEKTCPNINMTQLRNGIQQLTGRFIDG